ncbi:4-(cytidine 5'-diphospho)-2-C-methyl-D-erythritol kinase [Roseomonas xinghualingensis]|uniref:4-(cytidine 5'-diphospho)-2-C-methyl-D-erythritol kinase n=1 Tax=Roseomonas xinghualingensis TaxID=2986475 RepID=UPI0021F24E04|nr:4-(cytidine 5'-diphospho)-2-C-methyl-D-erythritol kinase [Roseomonas sp. SXEYE001]MCV4206213.1 4-(cytidine 5'-diphospho)-2-C-methyl-D-erythritol kinase [Roseomonas sp. SXEYE001]
MEAGTVKAGTGQDGVAEIAPAKINLHLHVTGRRADGYHLLDSLVVFAGAADVVSVAPGEGLSLELSGSESGALAAEPDNLVLRAARLLAEAAGRPVPGAALRLKKHLPVASGIGGGSADAAAALRALDRFWGLGLGAARLEALGLRLGADVPVCVGSRPARMAGIGEVLSQAPRLPDFGLVLANPRVSLATPRIFAARRGAFSAPAMLPEGWTDAAAMAADLRALGNDLEPPAISLCPPIAEVLAALTALPGALMARMSGSGATCFAVFSGAAEARRAAEVLPAAWWRWGGGVYAAK